MEPQFRRYHNPILVPLEHAVAIGEAAGGVIELAEATAIKDANGFDALMDGMTIGSGVAVDRPSHPSGNAGHGFQALESELDAEIDEGLQNRAGFNMDDRAGIFNATCR